MFTKGVIATCVVIMFAIQLSAQSNGAYRQPANERVIPQAVLDTYREQYPNALVRGWYITHITYWQNDYSSGWYYDWYGQRNVVVYRYEKPTYFEVEFINDPGELSRAIYNVYGYWYETRSQLKGLPLPILEALKESEYAGWKISSLKERIESPLWPVDVYRFMVSKGMRSRIVRMDIKGNVIQAKQLKD